MKIEYYRNDHKWEWEFSVTKGSRTRIVAKSPQTYASAGSAVRGAKSFLNSVKNGGRVKVTRRE